MMSGDRYKIIVENVVMDDEKNSNGRNKRFK